MTTIVTRAGKGSPLTNNEVDTNFTNLNGAKIETLTSTDSSVTITGTGDSRNLSVPVNPSAVSGPASATDNALVRFDGTTGKLVQNGVITEDDNGSLLNVNAIGFDTTPTSAPTAVGTMFWDSGNGTPSVVLDADVELQLGQENIVKVYNNSASTITNGSVVAVNGAQGQRPAVVLADADSEPLSAATLGIATEDILSGAEGFVTTFGVIRGIDTSTFAAGAPIYLSQTAGQFTATRPAAPAHTVFLGWVIKVNASSGEVFTHISNGWELDELHNVLISSPTGGNLLAYDQTNQYWKNINLTDGTAISITETAGGAITIANTGVTQATAGTGISVSAGTGNVTITNTAPDQTVSLTGAGTTSVTGTYPNFTITSNDQYVGTVTSVAATAGTGISISGSPITSSGTLTITNTAPDQTVSIASGTGISATGTYPSFTVTNTGVTSAAAGTGISVSASTGGVTITNTGVTSVTAGSGISVSASTGGVTITNTSTGATITDDTSTNATRYILFDDATSGTLSSVNTSSTKLTYNPSTGTASATVFSATSDERLKDEITIITDALVKIKQLRGINYKWKDSGLSGTGLSAQDVQRVVPEAVVVAPNGDLSVAYGNLLGLLVEGMKDLAAQVEELKSKVGK